MSKFRFRSNPRQDEKQIIAYLRPDQVDTVYRLAFLKNLTNREIMAELINAELTAMDMPAPLSIGHHRILRRSAGQRASVRDRNYPNCRYGRIPCAAWFHRDEVNQFLQAITTAGLTVQAIIERAIDRQVAAPTMADTVGDGDRHDGEDQTMAAGLAVAHIQPIVAGGVEIAANQQ